MFGCGSRAILEALPAPPGPTATWFIPSRANEAAAFYDSLERRSRHTDLGSQSADTIKLDVRSSCTRRCAPGSGHLRIARQREAAVVRDQSLPVHARGYDRVVFLRQGISRDDDLHVALAKTASRWAVVKRLPNPDSVRPASCHHRVSRPPKTERRPHAQVRPAVSDAGPRHAMLRKR